MKEGEGRDFYVILGVPFDAENSAIRRAFHEAARVWHPDRNPGNQQAEERFKHLSAAYQVLSDPEKRADYDRELGPRLMGSGGLVDQVADKLGGLWGDIVRRGRIGRDLRYTIELDFAEAALGTRRVIQVDSPGGPREFTITVPVGSRDGATTRVSGEGESAPPGGVAGDLHVVVRVRPHPVFVQQGLDLHAELPVPLHLAVAGGSVMVPTLEGTAEIRIPEGVAQGERLRLAGRGVPRRGNAQRGDLCFSVFVELPRMMNDAARVHAQALGDALPDDAFPRALRFRDAIGAKR